jgi:hypothetical protein
MITGRPAGVYRCFSARSRHPLPKPTDAGNPDFRLWNGTDRIVGYVEAKKPTEERLDLVEESEQLTRYRSTFPNPRSTSYRCHLFFNRRLTGAQTYSCRSASIGSRLAAFQAG